jgi:hypothetical protein
MKLKRMLDAALLLCGVGLMAAGCQRGLTETAAIPYHLVDVTTHIDPRTGKIVRVALWNYDDGSVETTTDESSPGSYDESRKSERLPQPTFKVEP